MKTIYHVDYGTSVAAHSTCNRHTSRRQALSDAAGFARLGYEVNVMKSTPWGGMVRIACYRNGKRVTP